MCCEVTDASGRSKECLSHVKRRLVSAVEWMGTAVTCRELARGLKGPPPGASRCGKHWQETGARTLRPGHLFLRSALLGHGDRLSHPEQGKSEAFCHTHSTVPFKRALLLRTFPHDDIRGEKRTASTLLGGTWCQNRCSFSRDVSVGKILSVAGRGSDRAP
ncbi:bcl-2-related protein A1 isoform X2 [Panthera leo]|uniref:bcl-2-related protein A1 isoform X2 n=1 Tax=Panthera leo TaxID=9689 RepID=UPI001C6960B8|nr:bcl-2-related protein A1 isoform X2 [Panthera leo]